MTEQRRNLPALFPVLATLAVSIPGVADPLHKVGSNGDHRHEGSGWIYPQQVVDFIRADAPYTIDGNNDVGAEYRADGAQGPRTAVVEIYYPDSAAAGARFETAALAVKRSAGEEASVRTLAEEPFEIPQFPGLDGVQARYEATTGAKGVQTGLYFFRTSAWIVSVRTAAAVMDEEAPAALDRFVRSLRWETLGTDPGDLHTPRR